MKKYDKEPFESLTEAQLDELLKTTKHQMPEGSEKRIQDRVLSNIEQDHKESKVTKLTKKPKWSYILGAAAALVLMVGFTQRDELKLAYTRAFGTESEKLLLHADKLDEVAEDEGLRLSAKSTFKDGNTTYVLMDLQDMTGDRLDNETQIDRWDMLSGGNTRVLNYDEKTKTATLLTSAISWEEHDDQGFTLEQFRSHKETYTEETDVIWDKILQDDSKWEQLSLSDGMGGGYDAEKLTALGTNFEEISKRYLEPDKVDVGIGGSEDVSIKNAAYKDGLLHVLVKHPNKENYDGLFLNLVSKETKAPVESVASYAAGKGTHSNKTGRTDYEEFVFDVPETDIHKYAVKVEGWKNKTLVKGNWSIRLKTPTELEKRKIEDIELEDKSRLTNVELSGLSLRADYQGVSDTLPVTISMTLRDGTVKEVIGTEDRVELYKDSGDVQFTFDYTSLPDIQSITINNQQIDVK